MKIRRVDTESHPKVAALLREAFPGSRYEERLIENLRKKQRYLLEWVCIHKNKFIGYIAFTLAYKDSQSCGLHLAPVAVNPEYQGQGVGTEMIRFALRQEEIRDATVFVLGNPRFYARLGFERCIIPICPFDKNNVHFLSINNPFKEQFTIGYEPEFSQ